MLSYSNDSTSESDVRMRSSWLRVMRSVSIPASEAAAVSPWASRTSARMRSVVA